MRREKVMSKLVIVVVLLAGLSGCGAGFFVGDNGQGRTYVASDAFGSAAAQASIGTVAYAE
jgi:hypothetical protein